MCLPVKIINKIQIIFECKDRKEKLKINKFGKAFRFNKSADFAAH